MQLLFLRLCCCVIRQERGVSRNLVGEGGEEKKKDEKYVHEMKSKEQATAEAVILRPPIDPNAANQQGNLRKRWTT